MQSDTTPSDAYSPQNPSSSIKRGLKTLSHAEIVELVENLGQPKFRAKQLEDWIWSKGATSFDQMSNLPKSLRAELAKAVSFQNITQVTRQLSQDGSRKYLLQYPDNVCVECVGMPTGNKLAVCASTQAGCAMGCAFCATGAAGLTRSLSASEIYDQVLHIRNDFEMRVSSVVFMGQGEPFMNYDNALEALRLLNSSRGLGIGARHLTISTCGVIPMIKRFANEPEQFTLAVSLHSAVQKTRDMLMPGVRKYSLLHLYDIMGEYVEKTGRRPTYEYALIGGINDSENELGALRDFCRGTLAHVNLIQLNEIPGSKFHPSTPARAQQFVTKLGEVGVEATIRISRGADIDAACGQLSQKLRQL